MAYTIVKSDGTVLTTIADGTINTDSTSLGLPGRNYPGYGQTLDTNFVHLLECFADNLPPQNPLRGQLWFNTNANILYVCPTNGAISATEWLALTATASNSETTFGAVNVTGNLSANNLNAVNDVTSGNLITAFNLTVTNFADIGNANLGVANVNSLYTTFISTGSTANNGTIIGTWTANGTGEANGQAGTAVWVTGGNLLISGAGGIGLKVDNIMFANGTNLFANGGAYSNANVAGYLPVYSGNVGNAGIGLTLNANVLNTGANTNPGTITGNWAFTAGSRLVANTTGTTANIANLTTTTLTNLGNVTVNGNIDIPTGWINGYILSGVISTSTPAQPNITSVGTLTSLAVSGNVTAANVTTSKYLVNSVETGIIALGSSQVGARALGNTVNIISTVSAGANGVALPSAVAGMTVYITNTTGSTLNVYPASGAQINSLGTNISYSHVSNATLHYVAASTTQWYTVGASYA